jgi:hypothetical protein
LPGFDRYVVTASADSTDMHGVTDWAIGWYSGKADAHRSSMRLIARWWRKQHDECDQAPWQGVLCEGSIGEDAAEAIRARVWRGHANNEY